MPHAERSVWQPIWARRRLTLGNKQLLKLVQTNRPTYIARCRLHKRQNKIGLVVRDAGATRPENATPMPAQPARSLIRVENRDSIQVGNCIESEFRLLCGPASLTGERHLDRAVSFSAWLLWSPSSSSACPRTLALVKLSTILHSARKSMQSSE